MSTHPLADAKDFNLPLSRNLGSGYGAGLKEHPVVSSAMQLEKLGEHISRERPMETPLLDAAISQADIVRVVEVIEELLAKIRHLQATTGCT